MLCCYPTALKRKKEQWESEMEELGSPRELQIKESELSERITSLEKKIHYSNIEEVTTIAYIAFLREFYKLSQSFCM